jgi:hypothetical protein
MANRVRTGRIVGQEYADLPKKGDFYIMKVPTDQIESLQGRTLKIGEPGDNGGFRTELGTLESGSYHILKVNKEKGGFDNGVTPKGVMIYNGKEAPKKRKRKSDAPPAGSESRKSKN